MASEENMNVDIEKNDENQENFEKKKKIIIISLSAALVFITLIAGLFFAKKNKESSHENDGLSEVIDEENGDSKNEEEKNKEKKENEEIIVNESEYFFEKKAGLVTINILSFIVIIVLFFFWENDKLPREEANGKCCEKDMLSFACCGLSDVRKVGAGLFEKSNWFGFATLGALIVITFLVEFVLNPLIGSISHFLSKDKNKKYFNTLGMSLRKRIHYLSSFSITKTLFIALSYLLCGIIVAMVARVIRKYTLCCCRDTREIVIDHGKYYFCGFCKVEQEVGNNPPQDNQDNNNSP